MRWQVDEEEEIAPPTADLRSAMTLVQSAMEATRPAPLSLVCDPVRGELSCDQDESAGKDDVVSGV